jgi:hypothetical protein
MFGPREESAELESGGWISGRIGQDEMPQVLSMIEGMLAQRSLKKTIWNSAGASLLEHAQHIGKKSLSPV